MGLRGVRPGGGGGGVERPVWVLQYEIHLHRSLKMEMDGKRTLELCYPPFVTSGVAR